jgi:cyclopropane fatty-acyl-phospholipid synthase-like methyltransferase
MELPYSPAADRNKRPIFEALSQYISGQNKVLEVASGTGQHAEYLCSRFPKLTWHPTDIEEQRLWFIDRRAQQSKLTNMLGARRLNVLSEWPRDQFDYIYCANMIHIAPFETVRALFRGGHNTLKREGLIFLYGPFFEDDVDPAPSNIAFNNTLQTQDPDWGIRKRETVEREAYEYHFSLMTRHEMPANNLLLVFQR